MKEKLEAIKASALNELKEAASRTELENIRVKYLGKKGELTQILRGMGAVSQEERPLIGKLVNDVKEILESTIDEASEGIKIKERGYRYFYAR